MPMHIGCFIFAGDAVVEDQLQSFFGIKMTSPPTPSTSPKFVYNPSDSSDIETESSDIHTENVRCNQSTDDHSLPQKCPRKINIETPTQVCDQCSLMREENSTLKERIGTLEANLKDNISSVKVCQKRNLHQLFTCVGIDLKTDLVCWFMA